MMDIARYLFAISLIVLAGMVQDQPEPDETQHELLTAQDQRDASRLRAFLIHPQENIRVRALIAAGSVQDTTLLSDILVSLNRGSVEVTEAAAFALGQMTEVVTEKQRALISEHLIDRLFSADEENVLMRVVEALGKIGNEASLDQLISFGDKQENGMVEGEIALAVGRYAYRGIKNVGGIRFAAQQLDSGTSKSDRWKGAFALRRIGVDSLLRPYLSALETAARSDDSDMRMFAATALGSIHSDEVGSLLLELAANDPDWRVRVNAIRAASFLSPIRSWETLLRLAGDPNVHVSLSALTTLQELPADSSTRSKTMRDALNDFLAASRDGVSERERGEGAVAYGKFFKDEAESQLRSLLQRGLITGVSFLRAVAFSGSDSAMADMRRFAADEDPGIRRVALETLSDLATSDSTVDPSMVRRAALEAISSDDMAVMTTAATMLEDPLLAGDRNVHVLGQRLAELRTPDDLEPMLAIIHTLGVLKSGEAIPYLMSSLKNPDHSVSLESAKSLEMITGRSFLDQINPHSGFGYSDYDWDAFRELTRKRTIQVETTQGTFRFTLLPDEAPFTCLSFFRLIERGFYDSLQFHRVVPNFVVQGGDPRGDGWGGPGYAIRSEFGYSHFDRGTVGVASAGRDTEGCQFFVTHSRQPHLDGRYTIFGKVTEGMEIIDRLQRGDRILRMRAME